MTSAKVNSERDTLLWSSFKLGDWDAFAELYNNYFKLLNNYGHKFTGDLSLIEDAVHDLFVKLWNSKQNLGNPESVKNYLFKSLRSIIFRKMQSGSKFVGIEDDYSFAFEVSFDHQYIADEEEKKLQASIKSVIQSLPARQQEIIYLRFYEGLGYEEIADIMCINVNSAYKLLYKALNKLQELLHLSKLSILLALLYSLKTNNQVSVDHAF